MITQLIEKWSHPGQWHELLDLNTQISETARAILPPVFDADDPMAGDERDYIKMRIDTHAALRQDLDAMIGELRTLRDYACEHNLSIALDWEDQRTIRGLDAGRAAGFIQQWPRQVKTISDREAARLYAEYMGTTANPSWIGKLPAEKLRREVDGRTTEAAVERLILKTIHDNPSRTTKRKPGYPGSWRKTCPDCDQPANRLMPLPARCDPERREVCRTCWGKHVAP